MLDIFNGIQKVKKKSEIVWKLICRKNLMKFGDDF